mgnify:CR=1 FL=1
MKFNSQICTTKEQSERLLSLGLKRETADMCLHGTVDIPFTQPFSSLVKIASFPIIPAWSLHRLIEIYKSVEDTSLWSLDFVNYNRLIQFIGLSIKHGVLNKEYLEERV